MKLGIDIDGCLADFNKSYVEKVIQVTGENKFPEGDPNKWIDTWYYVTDQFGYTKEQDKEVWKSIKEDNKFWWGLSPYEDAFYAMEQITHLWEDKHEIYFITNRPGVDVKLQTEAWLINFGTGILPTVLISPDKGKCCDALKLDFYIDDNTDNCKDVKKNSNTNVIMMTQRWNEDIQGVPRIPSWRDFFDAVKESSERVN